MAIQQRDAAFDLVCVAGVGTGQIGDGKRPVGFRFEAYDRRPGSWILIGTDAGIDHQGVVALSPEAVIVPALAAEITGQIVIVRAEVLSPSFAERVEHETAE